MPSVEHAAVLAHLHGLGSLVAFDPTLPPYANVRKSLDKLFTGSLPQGVISIPANIPGMKAEWLYPSECNEDRRVLFVHGGGYIAGNMDTHRMLAGWVAHHSRSPVLSFEYRIAPEHPFPAALEDTVQAYKWLTTHGPHGPGPARRRFVVGDSAGGGLALALLLALRDHRDAQPCHGGVTFSAWTDVSNSSPSIVANQNLEIGATKAVCDYFTNLYLNGADPKQPLASPVFGDLRGLPPLLLQVSDSELIFDDSVRFAERARAAGVEVRLDIWPGLVHVWQGFAPQLPEAVEALTIAGSFLRSL